MIVAVISLAIIAAGVGAVLVMLHKSFAAPRVPDAGDPKDLDPTIRQVWIPTVGNKRLCAWMLPNGQPTGTLVMIHGWGGNALFLLPLAKVFKSSGLNVLVVDARNHGCSDSDGHSSLPKFAEDLSRAVDWVIRQREHEGPVALCGHSLGGAAALLAAADRDDIKAVISLSTFANPADMMRRFIKKSRIPDLASPAVLRYVEWVIGRRYRDIAPVNTLCQVTCPVLMVHGTSDGTVPFSDFEAMRKKCAGRGPEFLEIPGAGHKAVNRFEEYGDALVDFLLGSLGTR